MTLGSFLINRRTQRRYRLDGCRRSRRKPLLSLALPFLNLITRQKLPDVVDFRPFLSPIEEQSTLGSCVGNALASIFEYYYMNTTGQRKDFSRLFIYYNARMMEDEVSQRNATETDSGADIQFAIVSLLKYGCCEDSLWPFQPHLINQQPSEEAYDNARHYRLKEFGRLSNNINQLRECLAQGYPFIMAIRIFASFGSNHLGHIPMPKIYEKSSQYRHAVVCVGYIHSEKVFIIRNSHGSDWGDHGYGYIPYDYVTDEVLTKDLWAIKSIKNLNDKSAEQNLSSPKITRSISQPEMARDRSAWDIIYTDEDDDEEEEKPSNETFYENNRRDPSPQLPREFTSSTVELDNEFLFRPTYFSHFPTFHMRSPMVYTPTPMMGSYPFHPNMYGSLSFFRPY